MAISLDKLSSDGLFKDELVITAPQDPTISLPKNCNIVNLCSNNYLGMSNNEELIEVAQGSLPDLMNLDANPIKKNKFGRRRD